MRNEVLTKLLEEKLKSKLDLFENRYRVQKEEIEFCERLVDDINKIMKQCNMVIDEKHDHEITEHTLKLSSAQSGRKDLRNNHLNSKGSQKNLEIGRNDKSFRPGMKQASQENIQSSGQKNLGRNASAQKNFSTNTKPKKPNEEEALHKENTRNGTAKKVYPKTPKNDQPGENNIRPFTKLNSQKNLGKIEHKLEEASPSKKSEKPIRKLNSVSKIGREKKEIKKHNSLNISVQNEKALDIDNKSSAKRTSEETLEKPLSGNKQSTIEPQDIPSKNKEILETPKKEKVDNNPINVTDKKQLWSKILERLSSFFNARDLSNILNVNKQARIFIIPKLRELIEKEIENYQNRLKVLNEKHPQTDLQKDIPPFAIPRGTVKAVELLNDPMYLRLFQQATLPVQDILFPYRVFFQFLSNPICLLKSDQEFWDEVCKFFLSEESGKTGDLINNVIKNFVFSEDNIYKVFKLCEGKEKKINPSVYSKICGTTGLIIFVIRDALEYTGIIVDKRTLPARLNKLYGYGLTKLQEAISKLK